MAYQHRPLNLNKAQIRLLRLDPPGDSGIIARVAHFDFDDTCPAYEAISYTWGQNVDGGTIEIEAQQLIVGYSLFRLLSILRHESQGWLWIDQICIDQTNSFERSHQVRMMHQIYTRASGVIAWLGDSSDDSDVAMQCVADSVEEKSSELRGVPITSRSVQMAMVDLVRRPYWSRLWILQEVIAAKKVDLMCGHKRVDWACFERFFHVHHQFYTNYYPAFKKAHTIVVNRSAPGTRSLLSLLQGFTDWECKDFRDKVYGLVGLVSYEIDLVIDYEKPVKTVLFDALKALYEDLNYHEDSKLTGNGKLWTLVNTALQLRRNLAVFSIGEIQLLQNLLSSYTSLWDDAIAFAGVPSDTTLTAVCEALLSNDFLRDRVVNEDSLAKGLFKRRFHRPRRIQSIGEEQGLNRPQILVEPSLSTGVDMHHSDTRYFYSQLRDFIASEETTMTFPPSLDRLQRRTVHNLAKRMSMLSRTLAHEGFPPQVHLFKQSPKTNMDTPLAQRRYSLPPLTVREAGLTLNDNDGSMEGLSEEDFEGNSEGESNGNSSTQPVKHDSSQNTNSASFPLPKTDNPRPHVCGTCRSSFTRLVHLKRHERSHTEEKPFECPQCMRCFSRQGLLFRHQKLHQSGP